MKKPNDLIAWETLCTDLAMLRVEKKIVQDELKRLERECALAREQENTVDKRLIDIIVNFGNNMSHNRTKGAR